MVIEAEKARPSWFVAGLVGWLAFALITLGLALSMVDRPFPGFLIVPSGLTGGILLDDWTGAAAGVKPFEQVVAFEGRTHVAAWDVYAAVRRQPPGTRFTYAIVPAGATAPVDRVVPSAIFGWSAFVGAFFIWWLAGVLHLVIGAVVVWMRPGLAAARAHWFLCQAAGGYFLVNFEGASTFYTPPWVMSVFLALWIPAFTGLALQFPQPLGSDRVRARVSRGAWAIALALLAALPWVAPDPVRWALALPVFLGLPTLAIVGAIGCWLWLAISWRTPATPRRQAQIITLGLIAAYVPVIVGAFLPLLDGRLGGVTLAAQCTMPLFPLAIAYAIVRRDLFEVGLLFRRVVLYGLTLTTLTALYAGVTWAGFRLLPRESSRDLTAFLAAFVVVGAFRPLYERLKQRLDRWFLGPKADALRALATLRLSEAAARAEAEARGVVLRQVVHDLRSDLFNISLAVEAVREQPHRTQDWETIERSLDRINRFLAEKLRGMGKGGVERRCELRDGISRAADAAAPRIAEKAQDLLLELPDLPLWVPMSTVELEQVMMNLLDNAIKFSPAGTRVRCHVSAEEASGALIEVSDEGPGLSDALLTDPFGGHRDHPAVPGTGLGLRNVKALIDAVGGEVSIRNGERGAVVRIRLDREAGALQPSSAGEVAGGA